MNQLIHAAEQIGIVTTPLVALRAVIVGLNYGIQNSVKVSAVVDQFPRVSKWLHVVEAVTGFQPKKAAIAVRDALICEEKRLEL